MGGQENFRIKRGSEEFGPYTAEEIDRYMQLGNIVASDLAWLEAVDLWVPVGEALASRAIVAPPPPRPPRPRHPAVLVRLALLWSFVIAIYLFAAISFFAGVIVSYLHPGNVDEVSRIIWKISILPIISGSLGLSAWLTVIGKLPGTEM